MRLHGQHAFAAVRDGKMRKNAGPLSLLSSPNALAHLRLGLVVPRRVGTAAARNRIKRLVREAFRLSQHDWPQGYDLIIIVHPHEPATLADYQRLLFGLMRSSHADWSRRAHRRRDAVEPGQAPSTSSSPSTSSAPSSSSSTPAKTKD